MAIKPLRRTEVSSSAATTPTSPISITTTTFPHSSRFESVDEPSEYDNLNYEEDGGPVRGEGTGLTYRDVEMGYMGSSALLLPPGHLLRPPLSSRASSIHSSVHASVRSSIRQSARLATRIWEPIKWMLSKMKLFIIIVIYSIIGAHLFMWLEVPSDLADKEDAYHARLIARENLYMSLNQIHNDNSESRYDKWKSTILQFEEESGLGEPTIETAWTFWMSFLYAGTIYTTIGYGNIACKTTAGRWATMIYAIFGIPIMIIILNDLGSFLLVWVKKISTFGEDLWLFFVVNCCCKRFSTDTRKRRRYLDFINRYSFLRGRVFSVDSLASMLQEKEVVIIEEGIVDGEDGLHIDQNPDSHQPSRSDPPVLSSFVATVAWILLSAAVFCQWEDWDFFTSVYFFVISLSTIGLGDVTPAHPEYMIATFGVVLIGLAMVTVFIDVVKEKIELMYMDLLEKQLELYMQRVDAGDPTAAEQMMEQLQSKSKYLFPLMSKSSGNKVMEQFKKEARERGIEVPSVLTDINPETGLPAFASGNKEDFKELIEQAEERREKEEQKERQIQQIIEAKRAARTPLGSDLNVAVSPLLQSAATPPTRPTDLLRTQSQSLVVTVACAVQTSVDACFLDQFSFGAQFTPLTSDCECQTESCESSDEGIQTWASTEDISTQIEMVDRLILEGRSDTSTAVQATPIFVTTGIQPEVSSIFSGAMESSEDEEEEVEEEEDEGVEEVEEWVTDEEDLEQQIREKIEKLHPKEHTTEEQRETLVRRHIELFEKQVTSRPAESGKKETEKKKKEIEPKEGTTRKLRELFERTGSTSSAIASPAPKRKQEICTVDESLKDRSTPSDSKSIEDQTFDETSERRKSRRKMKSDVECEQKRREKRNKTEGEGTVTEPEERVHLYSGSDSYDEMRKRSDSNHSDRSIASMTSTDFLIHAGSLQRRKDSDNRRETERKRVEERRRLLEREGAVDGGNTSMDEIDTLKDIKKKLIKRTMLRKKRNSMDSETSVHRKKSEEQKAERRKQKSELRFLKNVGLQTEYTDITHKLSTEMTTQTHGTRKASRRSQTKLTSIEKPSTAALQHPLSIRRKISLNSPDPSRLSIVSLGSPSSPLDLLDISTHGLRDLSPSPIAADGPSISDGTEIQRPSKLHLEDTDKEEGKMRRKSSEVEKRLKRRRKADATASGTVRESLSSASSISSLLSPETAVIDEDGVRVAEVSIDVYLLNGQLDQSGYQFIVDPIEGRREENNKGRSLPSSDGIKRIEIRYDWEEEELEDEEDEIMGKSGREIVGEEDEVEEWCLLAETQTEWEVEERGVQMTWREMEGSTREYATQSDLVEVIEMTPLVRPISFEMSVQTIQKLLTDRGSQSDISSPLAIAPVMEDGITQTEEYQKSPDLSDEICQTDAIHSPLPPISSDNFTQTEIPPPPLVSPDMASSCVQTENVSPLLDSQPCLAEEWTQTEEETAPIEKSLREEWSQTNGDERESIEGSTQTEVTDEHREIQQKNGKESTDSEIQCKIVNEWNEMPTQTEEIGKEDVAKETKETQYDVLEKNERWAQTEMEENGIEKKEVIRIDQESQVELAVSTSVEMQTEAAPEVSLKDEGIQSDSVSTVEGENQTEEVQREDTITDEKETQSEKFAVFDANIQTETIEAVVTCDQEIQSDIPSSSAIECQTEEEENEMVDKGTVPHCSFSLDMDTQTEDEKEDTIDCDCQTEEREEEKEERWTQSDHSLFHRRNQECQYLMDTVEEGTQFDELEKRERGCQTEFIVDKEDGECQTEVDLPLEIEREDVAVGTEEMITSDIGSETDSPSLSTTASQSVSSLIQHGVQTERDITHRETQTDEVKKKLKKKVDKRMVECQTDRDLLRETNCSAQTCSPPPSPPPFPVGFTVMDAATQCTPPLVTTSQTQYSSSCIRETSVQTDLNEGICAESQVDPFDSSPFSSSLLSLSNMIDVGIQTGVLARVEHMYATESRPEIIRGIAELHRSNSVNSQDSDVSSIYRGPVRVSPAMVGRDRRDSVESIERRPSTSGPSQHLSAGVSTLRNRFETPSTTSPLSPSTSREKIAVSATSEKTKVKKTVKKKMKTSEE